MRWKQILNEMTRAEAKAIFARYGVENPDKLDVTGLKSAHRRLVKANHPDRGGSDQAMARINAAYDVLKNPEAYAASPPPSRSAYDPAASRYGHRYSSEPYPEWANAGYSGGMRDSPSINREDYSDRNYVKKRMWELSGKSKEEWSIMNFDGAFFRGYITVYGSPAIFPEMAKAIQKWDRFFDSRAVFVSRRHGDGSLYLVWSDGVFHNPPIKMEHESVNSNPSNDQRFMRRLPEILDNIRDGERPDV